MKISYRTHPVLEKLHSGKLGKLLCYAEDQDKHIAQRSLLMAKWSSTFEKFNKNVQMISKPFGDAIHLAMPKMTSPELINDVFHQNTCGTFIWDRHTFCYSIEFKDGITHIDYFNFLTAPNGDILLNVFYSVVRNDADKKSWMADYYASKIGLVNNDYSHTMKCHNANLVAALNFIRYADVEIKHLPAMGKTKDIVCKYVNDTKLKIEILDSKWFTTLVKSDSFKVRGHFRLQPKKKEGAWTKELIWINDFQKKGYTAPARKLAVA